MMDSSITEFTDIHGPYMDFFTDFAFKKLLGPGSKPQLIDFLNSLLKDREAPITDLVYLQQEHLPWRRDQRTAIFDLYCKTDSGSSIIVELQTTKQKNYRQRTIFYSTFAIQEQAIMGDWDFGLAPVYCISLLNFTLGEFSNPNDIVNTGKINHQELNKVFYNDLTYVYVELGRFTKKEEELAGHRDIWFYILKNLATLSGVPAKVREAVFMEFLEKAQIARLSDAEQLAYHRSLKAYWDKINTEKYMREEGFQEGKEEGLQEGREEGYQKGREEGREEGRERQLKETIGHMRQMGIKDTTICEYMGITLETLQQLEK